MVNDNNNKNIKTEKCKFYDINVIKRNKRKELTHKERGLIDDFISVFFNKNILTWFCVGCLIKTMLKV